MILGSAITIQTTLTDTATAVTIDVLDKDKNKLVDGASMTNTDTNTWEYTYQSDENGVEGMYYFVIKATVGAYTYIDEISEPFRSA